MTFTAHYNPHWVITRVRGPVVWIVQETGKRKTVNKDKVVLVDSEISWDHIYRRPVRKTPPKNVLTGTSELVNRREYQELQPEPTLERETQQEVINEENLDQEDEGRTEPAPAPEEPMDLERPLNRALPKRGRSQDPEETALRRSKRIRRAMFKRRTEENLKAEEVKRKRINHVWCTAGLVRGANVNRRK